MTLKPPGAGVSHRPRSARSPVLGDARWHRSGGTRTVAPGPSVLSALTASCTCPPPRPPLRRVSSQPRHGVPRGGGHPTGPRGPHFHWGKHSPTVCSSLPAGPGAVGVLAARPALALDTCQSPVSPPPGRGRPEGVSLAATLPQSRTVPSRRPQHPTPRVLRTPASASTSRRGASHLSPFSFLPRARLMRAHHPGRGRGSWDTPPRATSGRPHLCINEGLPLERQNLTPEGRAGC